MVSICNDTHCGHAVDLLQSLTQQLVVAALGHQLERGMQVELVLEQERGDVSDTLERESERKDGGE